MRERSKQERQLSGCGYEPQVDNAFPWQPQGRQACGDEYDKGAANVHGFTVPVCAGYVCALPEVIEASHAYFFLKNGGLTQYTQGEPPSESLLAAVTMIESEFDKLLAYRQEQQAKPKQ